MNVSRTSSSFLAAVVLGIASVACFVPGDRPSSDPIDTGDTVVAHGYPPPEGTQPPPAPSATPSVDADGYYPPPVGHTERIETIVESPYTEILMQLHAVFESGDPSFLVERVTERFGVTLYDATLLNTEGGTVLDATDANTALGGFFAAGSRPVIQGYFESGETGPSCLVVVASPFIGSVEHPGAADPDPYGPQAPSHIPAESAGFGVCQDGDDWLWNEWAYGDYHEIVEQLDDARGLSGWRYVVIRP